MVELGAKSDVDDVNMRNNRVLKPKKVVLNRLQVLGDDAIVVMR
jgi:hypothetical protein